MTRLLLIAVGLFHDLIPQGFWTWLENQAPSTPALGEWFEVSFDETEIHLKVKPPGTARRESFQWQQIERICYRVEEMGVSDGIYLFLAQQVRAVPIEARGGVQLWQEILRRKLFDARLAITVAAAIDGIYCWPEAE